MNKEAEKILETIELDENETLLFELRQKILAASIGEEKQIITELTNRKSSHYLGHNLFTNQPYYFLFEAYALYSCGKLDLAIDLANRASSLFRLQNSRWNEALVHWFLYILYDDHSRKEDGCKELQTATAILEGLARGFQSQGSIGNCQECQNLLHELYRHISLAKLDEDLIELPVNKAYLLPPWMPIYEKVTSESFNMPIWAEQLQDINFEIQVIIIGGRWYSIQSVKGGIQKIRMAGEFDYGWAKVKGQDMNAARPIPLDDGDYVLFTKVGEVENNINQSVFAEDGIVVASRLKDKYKQEYTYLVRKFGKKVGESVNLYSESSKIGDEYKPIPLAADVQILGHVIAVAKPINGPLINTTLVIEQITPIQPTQKFTHTFLSKTLSPYLDAVAEIQNVICEISNKSPIDVEVKVIKQFAPLTMGLNGLLPSTKGLLEKIKLWQSANKEKLAAIINYENAGEKRSRQAEFDKENQKNRWELNQSLEESIKQEYFSILVVDDDQQQLLAKLISSASTIAFNNLSIKSIE